MTARTFFKRSKWFAVAVMFAACLANALAGNLLIAAVLSVATTAAIRTE